MHKQFKWHASDWSVSFQTAMLLKCLMGFWYMQSIFKKNCTFNGNEPFVYRSLSPSPSLSCFFLSLFITFFLSSFLSFYFLSLSIISLLLILFLFFVHYLSLHPVHFFSLIFFVCTLSKNSIARWTTIIWMICQRTFPQIKQKYDLWFGVKH